MADLKVILVRDGSLTRLVEVYDRRPTSRSCCQEEEMAKRAHGQGQE